MQEKLYAAILTKLRDDTSAGGLVELVGHSATSKRIAQDKPVKKAESPFFGVLIVQSIPALGSDVTQIQAARVAFIAYAAEKLTTIKLCDRMEFLLHAVTEEGILGTNRGFYDFSDSFVKTTMVRFRSRNLPDFNDDTDVWEQTVEANLHWVNSPCP